MQIVLKLLFKGKRTRHGMDGGYVTWIQEEK